MSRLNHGARLLTVAALAALAVATLTAHQARALTVTGRVVDAGSGAPIAGAVVEVLIGSRRQGTAVLTGAAGEFRLTDVVAQPGMRAVVAASKPGYLGGGAGQQRPGDLRRAFAFDDGDIEGVTLRLWSAGSISGRVVDMTGAPVPNAVVNAVEDAPPDAASDRRSTKGARTDDRGAYQIAGLVPDTYRVYVKITHVTHPTDLVVFMAPPNPAPRAALATSADGGFYVGTWPGDISVVPPRGPDGRDAMFLTTAYPNAATVAAGTPVTIESGQHRTNIDITMRSAPRVSIRGVVAAPAYTPAWRPELRLVDGLSGFQDPAALTRVRQDGTFEFLGAPPGDWTLVVTREAAQTDVVAADPSGMTAEIPLTVGGHDIDGLEMHLQPGVTVSARLEFDGPIPDMRRALVRLVSIGPTLSNGHWTTTSDAFTATGVPPGLYRFETRIPPNWQIASVTLGGRDITGQPVAVARADVSGLVIALTTRATEVVGRVRPPADVGLAGTHVAIFSVDRERFSATTRETLPVRDDGGFRFRNVVPGEYFVVAVPESRLDDWPSAGVLDALSIGARHVIVRTGDMATLDLEVVLR